MDKSSSIVILGQAISAVLGRILDVHKIWPHHCVCVSNEHLVVLSQMSDPKLFGLHKMPKWSDSV